MASAQNNIEVEISRANFIPYACHIDSATILTKNGELLQTIKIEGYQFDVFVDGKKLDIRALVREAFLENALHPHIAAHFHIIRRPCDLRPSNKLSGYFSDSVDAHWSKQHHWPSSYSNDLYITLIHEGSNFNIGNVGKLFRSFFFTPEKMSQRKYLDQAKARLDALSTQFLQKLAYFKPRLLQAVEENGAYHSEPLSLINHLVNFEHGKKIPMAVSDISDQLCSTPIDIDFYTLSAGSKRFAAIYSIKQYSELPPATVDAFLQFSGEFIISHQVMLGAGQSFIEAMEHKKRMAELSDDKIITRISGIDDILANNHGQWSDYALQQTTVMLMTDSAENLEKTCADFTKSLGSIGIVAVREDLMLEQIYYSQLPANFNFLKRHKPLNTNHIAGYSSLYSFPTGKLHGNLWGPAISVFKTTKGNPYFFSFHGEKSGNTLIAGPYGAPKTELLNFLMAQAERVAPRVIWFDTHRKGEMLLRALGGGYMQLVRNREVPRRPMNPLLLPDTPENRAFLEEWLPLLLLDVDGTMKADAPVKWAEVVKAIYALPKEKRALSNLALELPEPLDGFFKQWQNIGRYGHLFDNPVDETFLDRRIEGFDMTEMVQDRRPLWAALSYLMHRALQTLDGKPTIFVFDEAWSLLDNRVFAGKVAEWLEEMKARGAIAVFATEDMDAIPKSTLSGTILQKTGTRLLFPYRETITLLKKLMDLDDDQFRQYAKTKPNNHQVFLQKGAESVVLDMQLPEVSGMMEIMAGSPAQVTRMENVIAKVGLKPEQWLPEFYKQVSST